MKIGYQIPLYDGLVAFNTVSQQGQWIISWLIFKSKGWEVCHASAKYGMWINFGWRLASPARSQEPSHPKHSIDRANGASSRLLPSPVGARELFWRMMLELHGGWPLLASAVLVPSASALGKKRMYAVRERLPTSVRQHSSNLEIISSNKIIDDGDIYVHSYTHTSILAHINTQILPKPSRFFEEHGIILRLH